MQNRMIDRIRKSQLSSQMMQAAARGALAVDSGEMMEILVHLALHSKVFAEQARMTLAGWDEKASLSVASNPETSKEVLDYLVSPKNLRPQLLTALIENPSVERESLRNLVATGARWVVEAVLANETAQKTPELMDALRSNPRLRPNELSFLDNAGQIPQSSPVAASPVDAPAAAPVPEPTPGAPAPASPPAAPAPAEGDDVSPADEVVVTQAITNFLQQNQIELATASDKPFELVVTHDGTGLESGTGPAPAAAAVASPTPPEQPKAEDAPAAAPAKKIVNQVTGEARRDSTLQKIAKLNITGRIALAMRGNKEDRSLLIRDSTKLVALAVLDSPKVSEAEVEKFAQQKNVLEVVLRAIPMKRAFMKNYAIVRNLVFNPRTPLDVSLGLMKNLLVNDLKNLSGNKEVSDTVRKLAMRMFKQKIEKGGKG